MVATGATGYKENILAEGGHSKTFHDALLRVVGRTLLFKGRAHVLEHVQSYTLHFLEKADTVRKPKWKSYFFELVVNLKLPRSNFFSEDTYTGPEAIP